MTPIHFSNETFEQEVLTNKKTALVDFFASWCGPCKMLAPIIDEIAAQCDGSYLVGKIDIDENMQIAKKYRVMSVPTILAFRDGVEIGRLVGVQPKEDILKLLD